MWAVKIETLWFHAVFKCPNFRLLSEELAKLFRPIIIINVDRSHHQGSTCLIYAIAKLLENEILAPSLKNVRYSQKYKIGWPEKCL